MRSRRTPQALLLVAALVALLLPALLSRPDPTASAPDCSFYFGFARLHEQLPDVVGDCLENEHHLPVTGDALQRTSHGMLFWRKEDNWTGFTNGSRTWVAGPNGIQSRPNEARFAWESDASSARQVIPDDSPALADSPAAPALALAQPLRAAEPSPMADEPQPAETPTPTPELQGSVSAVQVPNSAQVVAFTFKVDINRPGDFKIEANFEVSENGSIAYTDGLVTSSEQGDFAPQPFDPAPVVDGRRPAIHWSPDVAFTPMAVQGHAAATVYAQCLNPGPLAGTLILTVIQPGQPPLTFGDTGVTLCSATPLFIPTAQPTSTPRPTSTPTPTPTPSPTFTPNPTQATQTAVAATATVQAATATAGAATATVQAVATATQSANATATATVAAGTEITLGTTVTCGQVTGTSGNRLITATFTLTQGGEAVSDATIQGQFTLPDGSVQAFTVTTDSNGVAVASLLTTNLPGTYTVTVTSVSGTSPTNSNSNLNVSLNANNNANDNITSSNSATC